MKKENVMIVDAISTGANYIHDIRELGYNPICIEHYIEDEAKRKRIRDLHEKAYALNNEEPPEIFTADPDYEKTLKRIKELKPLAIIPGCDEGIILATKLGHDLGLPGNDPKNLKKMMDKQHMHDALKDANIRYIKSKVIKTYKEAKEFASELDNSKVVVKPSIGKSTMGVCICQNDEELKNAVEINTNISFDIASDEDMNILIQEYIGGDEYIIDSVCCKGHNRVIDAAKYKKILIEGRGAIYDYSYSIDESDPHFKELCEYNEKVISALGIEYGAIHGEYKIDENGPVLIEMNSRVAGPSLKYTYIDSIRGEHSTALSLESYLNPEECIKKANNPLKSLSYAVIKDLIIHKESDVKKFTLEKAFGDLESFVYAHSLGDNKVYPKTVDLATSGGHVFLKNDDEAKLMEDVERINYIEEFEMEKMFETR